MSSTEYVIGLGSNLGKRQELLVSALSRMGHLGDIAAISSLYETDAVGPPQPPYLNAAARVSTLLEPHPLLDGLSRIEADLGRTRKARWEPRPIDLDILWSPGLIVTSHRLTVPHPELNNRRFALTPLLDVAPYARDPRTLEPYRMVLERLAGGGVRRVAGSESGAWARRA